MSDGALALFDSLSSHADLQELIDDGEAEGLYLECKAPADPRLTQPLKAHLAKAISGYSNTDGGVIIWGISTTKHQHSGLDVLTQIEPIARCRRFQQQVDKALPTLSTPNTLGAQTKVVKQRPRDTRGIVLAYIPSSRVIQFNLTLISYSGSAVVMSFRKLRTRW